MKFDTPWNERPFAPHPGQNLCRLDEVQDGNGKEVVFGKGKRAFSMVVMRRGEQVWGYVNMCPHFQIPINYGRDHFVNSDQSLIMCQNHYALFRFHDGFCIDGPCEGFSLNPVPVEIVDGTVVISAQGGAPIPDER